MEWNRFWSTLQGFFGIGIGESKDYLHSSLLGYKLLVMIALFYVTLCNVVIQHKSTSLREFMELRHLHASRVSVSVNTAIVIVTLKSVNTY